MDWREKQAASRVEAAKVALLFSDGLIERIGISQAKLYAVGKRLIVNCPTQADVKNLAARLGSDIRKELIDSGSTIREIEFWHELTNSSYLTPVHYRR